MSDETRRVSDADRHTPRRYPVRGQPRARRVDTSGMPRSTRRAVAAQHTTRRLPRTSQSELSSALGLLAVSPIEEDFFRAGDALGEVHDFSDLDEGYQPMTLWRAIVGWLRGERTAYTD
jgi:hypothetical protein